jgi:hypothetical protein
VRVIVACAHRVLGLRYLTEPHTTSANGSHRYDPSPPSY